MIEGLSIDYAGPQNCAFKQKGHVFNVSVNDKKEVIRVVGDDQKEVFNLFYNKLIHRIYARL